MDERFWANLDAMCGAVERATAGIDMGQLALAAENAARLADTIDFDRTSSALALGDSALRWFEWLSANSELACATLASMIERDSVALPEFSSSLLSTLNLVDESIRKLNFTTTELLGTRAHELAGLNAEVSIAVSSVAFDHLPEFDRSLGGRLASLSDSYRDIFVGMAAIESPLPDFVVALPPRDMIVKSTIVKSRTTTFEPADAQIALDDPAYGRSDVDLMLADLDVGYVTMLDEAVEVISGTSLGRVRHGSVSLRELCMHVLRHLAPNDKVRAWTQKPNHYHEDRPTRQARILYICRHVNYGPYGRYLEKSVNATVAFLHALNSLHDVQPMVSDFQLRLMLADAIVILRFLLQTASHRP